MRPQDCMAANPREQEVTMKERAEAALYNLSDFALVNCTDEETEDKQRAYRDTISAYIAALEADVKQKDEALNKLLAMPFRNEDVNDIVGYMEDDTNAFIYTNEIAEAQDELLYDVKEIAKATLSGPDGKGVES